MTVGFFVLAALTIVGLAAAMTMRNLVHCVLALVLGFGGIAALYLQLGAQFVGLTQVLIYVGAVAILAVFVIMMTQAIAGEGEPVVSAHWTAGAVIALATFAALAWAVVKGMPRAAASVAGSGVAPSASVRQIGDALMRGYIVPLEIMGVLLTAALIGAVVIAMHGKREAR
jgi:NADH-quinone oxidoreductase subunit J